MFRLTLICALLSAALLMPLPVLADDLGKSFQDLEQQYLSGDLDALAAEIYDAKAQNNEERALLAYLDAMLKTTSQESIPLLDQAASAYPSTLYGQKSMLERAKIHLLERQAPLAQALLQKINSSALLERYFWLSLCAEALNDAGSTISNAETYLRLDPDGRHVEDAYYLIAAAYQTQSKYQSAISTLNKLASLPGLPVKRQYFHYQLGNLHRLARNANEALQQYKLGFEINPSSQIAFQIEDELLALKAQNPGSVDLGFLYPYTELAITQAATPDSSSAPGYVDTTTPLKLEAKPKGGFFVQAGRFGVEANAHQLAFNIRKMSLRAHYFEDKTNKNTPWVVISGPYVTKTEADGVRRKLIDSSIDSFITYF